jgi:hypothetical protein
MGTPRHLTVCDLVGQPDHLYYGARAIAERVFGVATEETIRIVYRWQNELPPEQRPKFLQKIGKTLCAWESGIQRHAQFLADQT